MSKAVVICPDRRPSAQFLARSRPLALVPALGLSVLSRCLSALADAGNKEVTILASDRPDQVREAVGRGESWGLKLKVIAEPRELTLEEARSRYKVEQVVMADRLPGMRDTPLFESYAAFFSALIQSLPDSRKHRAGTKQLLPGVWAGVGCKVDSSAKFVAPCWLGENVWVRARATIGPNSVVEDSALVDNDAEVVGSWIGPWTYVGALTNVRESLAWASGLLKRDTGDFTEIPDPFLIGDLRHDQGFVRSSPWYGRAAALFAAAATSPLVLVAAAKNRGSGKPLFAEKRAVVPTAVMPNIAMREMTYSELNGFHGMARRWPQLWSIVRGEFSWVGNRPLTREQATQLESEFEQLWLAAPVGWVSLADTFNCGDRFDDDSRAHSSFYASHADRKTDRTVLRWLLFGSTHKPVPG